MLLIVAGTLRVPSLMAKKVTKYLHNLMDIELDAYQ